MIAPRVSAAIDPARLGQPLENEYGVPHLSQQRTPTGFLTWSRRQDYGDVFLFCRLADGQRYTWSPGDLESHPV